MGYAYAPLVRIVPSDSDERTIDLVAGFKYRPVAMRVQYQEIWRERGMDINYRVRDELVGWRVIAGFEYAITGDMSDHQAVVDIANAMQAKSRLFLSLDFGTNWLEITASKQVYSAHEPLGGRQFAGLKCVLTLTSLNVITSLTALGSVLAGATTQNPAGWAAGEDTP